MEYYAMLLSMNEGRPCHQSVNKRVKWLGALVVLLFLLGTGLFSFLWNVPLNTLRPAHAIAAPSAILVRKSPSRNAAAWLWNPPSWPASSLS